MQLKKKLYLLGYLLIAIIIFSFSSCREMHQKMYDAFHDKKKNEIQDSFTTQPILTLTPEEGKDDTGTGATSWLNAGIEDVHGLKIFIKKLRFWSESNNRDSIAANIQFPLLNDKTISSAGIFLQQYDQVFNEPVKSALKNQDLKSIFRNSQGVMIGNGEIWISNISESENEVYKITSINFKTP
jgi:hypothetical protein